MDDVTYETGDELGRARRPERKGIPVGDNADGGVYTVTVDEETGERVVVVDTRALTWLMGDAGGLEIGLRDLDRFLDPLDMGFTGNPSVRLRADVALRDVLGAIGDPDTVTIFKWGGGGR